MKVGRDKRRLLPRSQHISLASCPNLVRRKKALCERKRVDMGWQGGAKMRIFWPFADEYQVRKNCGSHSPKRI